MSKKSNRPRFEDITVKGCYEGDSCSKKIILACKDTPEIICKRANPIKAIEARNYLDSIVKDQQISISQITEDRDEKLWGVLSFNGENLQEKLVNEEYAQIYRSIQNNVHVHHHKKYKNQLKRFSFSILKNPKLTR